MAKIIDPDFLVVGTELAIDTTAKTITLNVAGNLIAKDGVTMQALYSKLILLWTSSTYQAYPFPLYAIDSRSGQYQVGFDGATYNGWTFANDATRSYIRDAGWSEYSAAGALQRQYVGVVSLGDLSAGAQPYYQKVSSGSPINTVYLDEVNEAVQVYGDASNGAFDSRFYFKLFCREPGKTYDDALLGDVGETGTGAFKIQFPLSNADDLKIQALDAEMTSAPYSSITVTYYGTDQLRTIGSSSYPFRVIIDGAGATAEQIYTKVQYLLRQNADIDSGAGTVIGKTASALLAFIGDTLKTSAGVYIDNFSSSDINRLVFTDHEGIEHMFPFTAAGTLNFNSFLASGSGYYRMFFADNYGTGSAITVNDADGTPITGTITAPQIGFTFAYDSNAQGSHTPGTDAAVVVVAGSPGSGKPVVSSATITRTAGQTIALVAEQDRAYLNP
jgi:hypothetical protein